jgi:hypothetical protein
MVNNEKREKESTKESWFVERPAMTAKEASNDGKRHSKFIVSIISLEIN